MAVYLKQVKNMGSRFSNPAFVITKLTPQMADIAIANKIWCGFIGCFHWGFGLTKRCNPLFKRNMTIYNKIEDFASVLAANRPIIGLDFGDKTIGVAISDRRRCIATPKETIKRGRFAVDLAALQGIIVRDEVCGIILGLPIHMNGDEGVRCQKTRAFARNLTKNLVKNSGEADMPIGFWDERLSSRVADRAMIEADMSRAKRAELINHVAAGFILQSALDRLVYLAQEG